MANHRTTILINFFLPGTGSVILTERENDASSSGFNRWNFTSVHFWGEKCRDSLANKPWKLYFKIQVGAESGCF